MHNTFISGSIFSIVFIGFALMVTQAQAENSDAADKHAEAKKVMYVDKPVFGNAQAGKQKVAACAACHGVDGNSTNADWPTIAGQHPQYMYEQLKMIQDGSRSAPLMVGQLDNKSEQDLKDMAAYFSGVETKSGKADADLFDLGQTIFRGGDQEKGIPACASCHGANGKGNPMSRYPSLVGQKSGYVNKSLKDYASGARNTNAQQKIMHEVAGLMSDAEMQAVASYVSGLQ